ncbi:MAG: DNA repair protein RadC [Chloroflexota bacterium]|nr:DNA repair protein RadC [Chloroflexota bacterium]
MQMVLDASENPRERLLTYGPSYLSNAELLALVLGNEAETLVADKLLASMGGLRGLRKASKPEFKEQSVTPRRAAQIQAALELGQRLSLICEQPMRITSPADVAGTLILQMGDLETEQLRLVLLNTKNDVIGWPVIYTGGLRTAIVRLAEIFREPIRQGASGFIVAHNHPSKDATPSPEDVQLTRELVHMGKQMDIDVLDHIIIGGSRWTSLRSLKLGF